MRILQVNFELFVFIVTTSAIIGIASKVCAEISASSCQPLFELLLSVTEEIFIEGQFTLTSSVLDFP